jgi:dTDP-4-dehydrorhamnose reductase
MAKFKSILVVGGSGFVGTHLAQALAKKNKVYATFYKNLVKIPGVSCLPLDALEGDQLKRVVFATQPEIVIFVAGKNDQQWAEDNDRLCERIHGGGPASVVAAADILQPKFVFLSSPYVFDGKKGNYHSDDVVLGGSVLGKSKLSGENAVKGKSLNYIILRSSMAYGRGNGKNNTFLDDLRVSLSRGKKIEFANDQYHNFLPISALVEFIIKAAESPIKNRTVHYGGLTKITYYEFAKRFARRFGFDESLVLMDKRAREGRIRQVYEYSLNSTEAFSDLNIKPLLLEEGFDLFEKQLISR